MPADPTIRDHKAWLGYVQQEGLVVSPAALVDAQVVLDRNTIPMQERFLPFLKGAAPDGEEAAPAITDFPTFARGFLQWPDDCLHGLDPARPLPDSLTVVLQDGESISSSFAFKDPRPKDADQPWLLLVQTLPLATDLDARTASATALGRNCSPFSALCMTAANTRRCKCPIAAATSSTPPASHFSKAVAADVRACCPSRFIPRASCLVVILVRVHVETNYAGPCADTPHPIAIRSQPWQARFQSSHHSGHV